MLILKYFVVVGAVLAAGLIALSAHMAPSGVATPAMIHGSSTASLAVVPPNKPAVKQEEEPVVQAVTPPAPTKASSSSRRASRSEHAQRRAH
jgi:hypothetical protein